MLRFDERVHLPKNRENTITFLVNGEPIGTIETLAPGAKTVDIPVPPIDYDSVTTALGYVPYDSSNPNGYITGINSSDVITALGYTPYDSSNPNNYITSSALADYVTLNTNQTITAVKSFHNAELLTDNFITLNGTTAYLRGQSGINYYNLMNLNNSGITVGSANQPMSILGNGTSLTIDSNGASFSNLLGSFKINNMDILTNEATATNSLGIGYTTVNSSYIDSINIGNSAQVTATNCLAIGNYASAEQVGAIAIYSSDNSAHRARANGYSSIAIGENALAINANYTIAIGKMAIAQNTNAIQLGTGNNASSNTFQVGSYRLLDTSTGLIPDARLSSNIARITDIPTITVDQVYDATSSNAQSGVAIDGAGFLTGITSTDVTNALGYTPVNKAGDTMTGNLSLNDCSLEYIKTAIVKGTSPSANSYSNISICDSEGNATANRLGAVEVTYTSDGQIRTDLIAYKPEHNATTNAKVRVGYNTNGNAYCEFPDTTCVDGQWVFSSTELANGVAWNSTSHSDAKSYSLSSYLPNDSYKYEVLVRANATTTSTAGKWIRVGILSDIITTQAYACACRTRTASTQTCSGSVILPIGSGRKISVAGTTDSSSDGTYGLRTLGYRRIGTNS